MLHILARYYIYLAIPLGIDLSEHRKLLALRLGEFGEVLFYELYAIHLSLLFRHAPHLR